MRQDHNVLHNDVVRKTRTIMEFVTIENGKPQHSHLMPKVYSQQDTIKHNLGVVAFHLE